ncbi:MAG: cobalamin-dependent protein, partial [Magnetococcus sp. YQC-5]
MLLLKSREREKKVKIYLSGLSHNYITLANATFPLGTAYIASALQHYFKDEVSIQLFKSPEKLDKAIQENPPDIYLFSSYVWSQNLSLSFARNIKKLFPNVLTVCGGPNISKDIKNQEIALRKYPYIDFFLMGEGENAICYLLNKYFELDLKINLLKESDLFSTITLLPNGIVKTFEYAQRIGIKAGNKTLSEKLGDPAMPFNTLDDIPSPYLNGLLDQFFDNQHYPLVETNRGCPFTCTFCQQGELYFNKIAWRSLETTKEELHYIASMSIRNSPGISRIEIADANFGMYAQDLEYCKHIRNLQDTYNWP